MENISEAGKDANARPETAGSGDSLPVKTLSRVAPQSVQLAKDHALLAHSAWCGVVFSLALVITALNLLPPVEVGYRITTQVLASPQRLEAFKREVAKAHSLTATQPEDQSSASSTGPGQPGLVSIAVLDDHSQAAAQTGRWQADGDGTILVEVVSLWPGRTTSGRVQRWLDELTKPDEKTLRKVDAAQAQRFARWEVQVHELYLADYRKTRQLLAASQADKPGAGVTDKASGTGGKMRTASATERVPMQFALLGQPAASSTAPATQQADEMEQQLIHALEEAKKREKNSAADVADQTTKVSGSLSLAAPPRVRAAPHRTPAALIMSMFVLAMASAALGGWANHRAQSGGTYYAADVAANMQLLGLPVLGKLALPVDEINGAPELLKQKMTSTRRWLVAQLLAFSEMVVLFWCLAIAIRMVLDPLWRAMLWENPLAGLSRLFIGLP